MFLPEAYRGGRSAVVLNMLTSSRAISLYPYETMRGRALRLQSPTKAQLAFSKYADRGFQMEDGVREIEHNGFSPGYRHVGDDLCVVVQLSRSRYDQMPLSLCARGADSA